MNAAKEFIAEEIQHVRYALHWLRALAGCVALACALHLINILDRHRFMLHRVRRRVTLVLVALGII
jgi:hypothetical protein